jgi:hypothetical protein
MDLVARAAAVLERRVVYATPKSTCFRVCEMYDRVTPPVYSDPVAAEPFGRRR